LSTLLKTSQLLVPKTEDTHGPPLVDTSTFNYNKMRKLYGDDASSDISISVHSREAHKLISVKVSDSYYVALAGWGPQFSST